MPVIREEAPDDRAAIREVNRLAFQGEEEARLVDRLREDGLVVASLVAVDDAGQIVGHILFSDVRVETATELLSTVSLAPMAVRPEVQRQGFGSALVRRGIELCRERGKTAVIVLGHPHYYPRFGFSAELAMNLSGPFSGEPWMALELTPGALLGIRATVVYPEAFGIGSPSGGGHPQ